MSGIDRLAELRGASGATYDEQDDIPMKDGVADITGHMKCYEPIKKALDIIKANVCVVEKLKDKNKTTATEKARKEVMNSLDDIMISTNQQATMIKKTLDNIKNENTKYSTKESRDSAKSQMRTNLYQTHIRRFHQVMNDYNAAVYGFKQDLQKRTRREIKIVHSNISDDEIDKIIESGKANDVIKQALISDNLQDVIKVIEERHLDILKLEQQVLEIYELFRDLATLVDLQQESLDVIDNRIKNAKHYTENAEVKLQKAEDYQKKTRRLRCCLLFILLAALVAILAPTLLSTVAKS